MFKFESTSTDLLDQSYPAVVFTLQDEASLHSMIEAFEAFLRATGYDFAGHLDIIEGDMDLDQLEADLDQAHYDYLDLTAGDNKGFKEN